MNGMIGKECDDKLENIEREIVRLRASSDKREYCRYAYELIKEVPTPDDYTFKSDIESLKREAKDTTSTVLSTI
jgi:hypothetical protein